jgi:hypothetical protein
MDVIVAAEPSLMVPGNPIPCFFLYAPLFLLPFTIGFFIPRVLLSFTRLDVSNPCSSCSSPSGFRPFDAFGFFSSLAYAAVRAGPLNLPNTHFSLPRHIPPCEPGCRDAAKPLSPFPLCARSTVYIDRSFSSFFLFTSLCEGHWLLLHACLP